MDRVGPYEVGALIASGGSGKVFRAVGPGGPVALKVFDARLRTSHSAARFEKEARIRIDHPNVVSVLDAGTEDGNPWIALELLEGEALSERIGRALLTPEEAVDLGIQICRGLEAAHALGVIHRDLKPENLFVCADGTIKIIDFGIALVDTDPERLSNAGLIVGTPWYLPPEQARGDRDLDTRADIWSLGCVLYEALTGTTPFERGQMLGTVLAILREDLEPLTSHAPHVPAPLAVVVERCLVKKREHRWSSAEKLRRALEEVDLGAPPAIVAAKETRPSILPGEQRIVAILFAEGVEEPASVEETVTRHGGSFLPLYGGRAVGLFGSASWEGDELERAARAALEARWWSERVAIAAGRATSHGASISGEALDAAERGCRAAVDGVAIDPRSARMLEGSFVIDTAIGGVARVLAQIQTDPPPPPARGSAGDSMPPPAPEASLLGRSSELAQMRASVRSMVADRRAAGVLVVGPPGIGKSRLRVELEAMARADAPGIQMLFARADPLGRTAARSLVAAALARHARIAAVASEGPRIDAGASWEERREAVRALTEQALDDPELVEETAPFLGELLGVPMGERPDLDAAHADPQLMGQRLDMAVRDFFAGLCARGPVLLSFEDVHWADDASLRLCRDLLEQLAELPLLVCLTARPWMEEEQPILAGAEIVRIEPRPLAGHDAALLAEQVAGRALPESLVESIRERCGGNPLFIEQIVAEAAERGALFEGAELPIPLTVEGAIQSRLDHLPTLEKELCKKASIWGRPFSVDELEGLGAHDADALLEQLRRRGIVSVRSAERVGEGREYRFRLPLVGEVAYRMIAEVPRAALHRRAAEMLVASGKAGDEEIAVHWDRGRAPAEASRHYVDAALTALRSGDLAAILRCSGRALELGVRESRLTDLHLARAEALQFMGRFPDQERALASAQETAVTIEQEARIWSQRVGCFFRQGRRDEAAAAVEKAVEAATFSRDPELEVRALTLKVNVLVLSGRHGEAQDILARADVRADEASIHAKGLVATARALAATDPGGSLEAYSAALEAWKQTGDLLRLVRDEGNLAEALNRLGAYEQAAERLRDVISRARRLGNRNSEGYAWMNLGYALARLRRHEQASEALSEANAIGVSTGNQRILAFVTTYEVLNELMSGRAGVLSTRANAAAQSAAKEGLPAMAAYSYAIAALADLRKGNVVDALVASQAAMAIREELGGLDEGEVEVFLSRARALERAGLPEEAALVGERAEARMRELEESIADPAWRAVFRNAVEDVVTSVDVVPDALERQDPS